MQSFSIGQWRRAQGVASVSQSRSSEAAASTPIQLEFDVEEWPAQLKQRFRIAGGSWAIDAPFAEAIDDLGDQFEGHKDACVALHLVASIAGLAKARHDAREYARSDSPSQWLDSVHPSLADAVRHLAAASPLTLTFGSVVPAELANLHGALTAAGATLTIHVCWSLQLWVPLRAPITLGIRSADARLLKPLLIGVREGHCVLARGAMTSPTTPVATARGLAVRVCGKRAALAVSAPPASPPCTPPRAHGHVWEQSPHQCTPLEHPPHVGHSERVQILQSAGAGGDATIPRGESSLLHTGASSSQTVDERVGHSTPDCANAAGAVAIGPDSGGKPSQPQPAPATQARISVARRPTSDQAWRRMVEWASDPAQSGESFAVRLLSRKWANGSSATLARGSCSAKGECALRNCKFAITATYDAARKQLVFAKQNPHRPQSFCALSWTRAGFKVASTVEHMPVPPGRQEVRERVREWCTNAGAHMEPFPLVLHEKQGNAGTALYRGVCRPQSPCGGPPACKFVAQAVYDVPSQLFFITAKNRHAIPVGEPANTAGEQAPRRQAVRRPTAGQQWATAFSETVARATAPKTVHDMIGRARSWAMSVESTGFEKPFVLKYKSKPRKRQPQVLRAELTCGSCAVDGATRCTWFGIVECDKGTHVVSLVHHGEHLGAQRKRHRALTTEQASIWQRSKAGTAVGKLGAFAFVEGSPPSIQQSQGRLKRQRKLSTAARGVARDAPLEAWPIVLIDKAIADAGIKQEPGGELLLAPELDTLLLGRTTWCDAGKDTSYLKPW